MACSYKLHIMLLKKRYIIGIVSDRLFTKLNMLSNCLPLISVQEMSGRLIEEREMLSLGTRSRGTSRNTSRATSPAPTKSK